MFKKPNLLIIGTQKGGTSWLHNQLRKHPEIFMSKQKELFFFTEQVYSQNLEKYISNFKEARDEIYIGESTPSYFWTYSSSSPYQYSHNNKDIVSSIYETLGKDLHIIIMLRHPVQRAISSYLHQYKMGRLNGSESILDVGRNYGIIDMGFYKRHYLKWTKNFNWSKIMVFFYEDMKSNQEKFYKNVCQELEVTQKVKLDYKKNYNPGYTLIFKEDHLTIDLSSEKKSGGKLEADIIKREKSTPKFYIDEINELAKIYKTDIDFINLNFARNWLNHNDLDKLDDYKHMLGINLS